MIDFLAASLLGLAVFSAILLFYYHHLRASDRLKRYNFLIVGSLFGCGTSLVLLHSASTSSGFLIDARILLMGFSGILLGLPGALVSLIIAVATRLLIGGEGIFVGCLTLLLSSFIGVMWNFFQLTRSMKGLLGDILFGVVLSLSLLTILLFPKEEVSDILASAGPILLLTNIVGAVLYGWMERNIRDIADYRSIEIQKSKIDPLTGLLNRRGILEKLDKVLLDDTRTNDNIAVIVVDIDDLKSINDTLGHDIGDALLVAVSSRLAAMQKQNVFLGRLAGDEFVFVVKGKEQSTIAAFAAKILNHISAPFNLQEEVIAITASLGIVSEIDHLIDANLILQNADIAVTASKATGRNQYTFFSNDLREMTVRRSGLTQSLQESLVQRKGFWLDYQPQFCALTKRLVGAEALLRWRTAEGDLIGPEEFIPVAESAGLVRVLDRMVVSMAVSQLASWNQQQINFKVSINISAQSFRLEDIAEHIVSELGRYGVSSSHLCVEITETVYLESSPEVLHNLDILKSSGVSIAIDDFGTGHSSLGYLQKLPLDIIKIDRCFVQEISASQDASYPVVVAIIAMSKALGLKVIAEGVETEDQFNWLANHGCDFIQGFLLGKPVNTEKFKNKYASPP